MRSRLLFLVALLVIAVARPGAALTGREVIDAAQTKNHFSTWKDRVTEIGMETFAKSLQRSREAIVSEQTDPRGEHRTFMEFTAPADTTGTLFLHLSPRDEKDQQWLWTPSARKARRIADAGRDENFFGTDLSYRDLEMIVRIQQWNDTEATAALLPEATVDGKPCNVVELTPHNQEFPYAKYRLWFGKDDALLWRVEIDDTEGRLFKRITLGDYERIQDYATARQWEVATVQYDTRTVFKVKSVRYDTGVPDDLFTVASVQRGR